MHNTAIMCHSGGVCVAYGEALLTVTARWMQTVCLSWLPSARAACRPGLPPPSSLLCTGAVRDLRPIEQACGWSLVRGGCKLFACLVGTRSTGCLLTEANTIFLFALHHYCGAGAWSWRQALSTGVPAAETSTHLESASDSHSAEVRLFGNHEAPTADCSKVAAAASPPLQSASVVKAHRGVCWSGRWRSTESESSWAI